MPREEPNVLTPQPGAVVGQKYRILRTLGEGGMGTVYEAENSLTLKRAAIKWLHPRLIELQDASNRLLHEARATARIRHRNVVDVYDVLTEGSSVFLVMELLEGEPLSVTLAREQLLLHDLIRLLLPAMAGVAAAHTVHVVHRDIKPDNIFLTRESGTRELVPKVIDFGISRVFEADGSRLTRSGMTMGTPKYVSYEQLRGGRDVDGRADVYAFGVILYEAVVGAPPYDASTLGEQAISFVTTEPLAPSQACPALPIPLAELIRRAIQRDRELRIATMQEFIEALGPYAEAASFPVPVFAKQLKDVVRPHIQAATTAPADDDHAAPQVVTKNGLVESLPAPRRPRAGLPRRTALVLASAAAALGLLVWISPLRRTRSSIPGQESTGAAPSKTDSFEQRRRAPNTLAPLPPARLPTSSVPDSALPTVADRSITDSESASAAPPERARSIRARRAGTVHELHVAPVVRAIDEREDASVAPHDPGQRLGVQSDVAHRAGGLRRNEF